MSLAFNNEPKVKVDPHYILYFSEEKNAYVKKQHEHFNGHIVYSVGNESLKYVVTEKKFV
jgi:hypothetical protein